MEIAFSKGKFALEEFLLFSSALSAAEDWDSAAAGEKKGEMERCKKRKEGERKMKMCARKLAQNFTSLRKMHLFR